VSISITTVFTNNGVQAIRLPLEARLPKDTKKVAVRIRGRDRIITPVENTWDHFFLKGLSVTDDFMNERGIQKPVQRESL